nr:hypothetical protein [Tanacetum cinerariifolium]
MILESIENGPLLWPTIEENRVTNKRNILNYLQRKQFKVIVMSRPPISFSKDSHQRDLHTTNVDQLHAYLRQHEFHANEVHLMHEFHHNVYNPSSSIPLVEYALSVHQQSNFSQPDSGLIVPVFQKGDDPIDAINHMMSFLTVVVTSWYPPTNNQLRNSSNPQQQATINNSRVTIQPIQGRQNSLAAGEGHMLKQCTKPKRKRDEAWFKDKYTNPRRKPDAEWFKDKVLLVQAQANGQVLLEEELEFLADPGFLNVEISSLSSSRLRIGRSNFRLPSDIQSKEATLQVATAKLYHNSIRFKIDTRKSVLNLEAFREMLHVSPRIPNQPFADLPTEEEVLDFLRFLGHSQDIRYLTDVNVNKLYQPWRSFAYVINKCLAGKSSGVDSFRLSQAQML